MKSECFLLATKGEDSLKGTLKIFRADGTFSSPASEMSSFQILEDLQRAMIEKTCRLEGSIHQVMRGKGFQDLAPNIQFLQTEAILASLQQEQSFSNYPSNFFLSNLMVICGVLRVEIPILSPESIQTLRTQFQTLKEQWENLPAGGSLKLDIA
jgi:hypothetical protein